MNQSNYRSAALPPSSKARYVNRYEEMRAAYPSLSLDEFCKMNNLSPKTFSSWRKNPANNRKLRAACPLAGTESEEVAEVESFPQTPEETWAFYSEKGPRCFIKEAITEGEAKNYDFDIIVEMKGFRIAFSEGFSSMELGEIMAILEGLEKRRKILKDTGT